MFQMQRINQSLKLAAVAAIASLLLAGCGGSDSPTPPTSDSTSTQGEPTTDPTTTEPTTDPTVEPTTEPTEEPSTEPASEPTESQTTGSDFNVQTSVATYVVRDDGGVDSLLEGNLMLLDTGCLVVREKAGENAFIPVFPANKEAVEFDGVTLRLGTQDFTVGDAISLNGLPMEWTDEYPELDYTMPEACSGLDTWWASPQGM